MALFFHSDDVDQLISFKDAVEITESALRDLLSPRGVNAPRKRLNLHREIAEGSFDTVLNVYAGDRRAMGRSARRSRCIAKRSSVARRSGRRSIPSKPNWR